MTENQKNICSKTLQEIKKICEENNHVYTPLNVFYRPSGQQFVKVAELYCTKHKGESFHQLIQDVKLLRKSKECPGCYSEIQREIIRVPIRVLEERIKNSANKTIRENQIVIGYKDSKYKDRDSLVEIKCNIFGHHKKTFPQRATSVGINNCCPECAKTRDYKKEGEMLIEKISKILEENNRNFYFVGNIERSEKRVIFYDLKCKNCGGSEWEREFNVKSVKCNVCHKKRSKGESIVFDHLQSLNIKFELEKTFEDLKNIQSLECDFFLPQSNLIIEFDGQQHYKPIKRFGGIAEFEKTINNDWIKNRYALKRKINILRIPFYEIKNIKILIDDCLNKINEGKFVYKIAYCPIIYWKRKRIFNSRKKHTMTSILKR